MNAKRDVKLYPDRCPCLSIVLTVVGHHYSIISGISYTASYGRSRASLSWLFQAHHKIRLRSITLPIQCSETTTFVDHGCKQITSEEWAESCMAEYGFTSSKVNKSAWKIWFSLRQFVNEDVSEWIWYSSWLACPIPASTNNRFQSSNEIIVNPGSILTCFC